MFAVWLGSLSSRPYISYDAPEGCDNEGICNDMTTKCYLFELGFTVVKPGSGFWYERDRDAHKWIESPDWFRRYYDAQYDVIEIEYDEEEERIVSRRRIQGFWSYDDERLFEFERDDD